MRIYIIITILSAFYFHIHSSKVFPIYSIYNMFIYIPWRIHGAGIYANIKGVYWWYPCYHIYQHHGSYGLWNMIKLTWYEIKMCVCVCARMGYFPFMAGPLFIGSMMMNQWMEGGWKVNGMGYRIFRQSHVLQMRYSIAV